MRGARREAVRAVVPAVVRRPRLWPTALAQCRALAPPGWWRRAPFLPLPDRRWLEFRLTTAYGNAGTPDADEVVGWLEWARDFPRNPHGGPDDEGPGHDRRISAPNGTDPLRAG